MAEGFFRSMFMSPRGDWNAMGPKLPCWFAKALWRVDPALTLQFFPPANAPSVETGEGTQPELLPDGAWSVCLKLKRTGWLFKRAVYTLADPWGRWMAPNAEMVRLIRQARNMHRRAKGQRMDQEFDKAIQSMKRADGQASRERSLVGLAKAMRRHGFTQYGGRRIRVPEGMPRGAGVS